MSLAEYYWDNKIKERELGARRRPHKKGEENVLKIVFPIS
jgi:hypothetical protein